MSKDELGLPWTIEELPRSPEFCEGGMFVVVDNENKAPIGVPKDRALLMAAAPELADALRSLVSVSSHTRSTEIRRAIDALKKAGWV